jgi:hypothetical protein
VLLRYVHDLMLSFFQRAVQLEIGSIVFLISQSRATNTIVSICRKAAYATASIKSSRCARCGTILQPAFWRSAS